jgi:hypothetical protein
MASGFSGSSLSAGIAGPLIIFRLLGFAAGAKPDAGERPRIRQPG